jgi:hypothetical protein
MKKKMLLIPAVLVVVVVIALVVVLVLAKTAPEPEAKRVHLVVPDGVPLLTFAGFATGSTDVATDGVYKISGEYAKELGLETDLQIVSGPDQLAAAVQSQRPEMAVVPINMAAKLHTEPHELLNDGNASGTGEAFSVPYKLAAVTTWGLNELVCSGSTTDTLADLLSPNKDTIYTFGKSETPGIVLRTLLEQQQIPYEENAQGGGQPSTINLMELSTAQDVVAKLTQYAKTAESLNGGESADMVGICGLLPEPVATTFTLKNKGFATFDLQQAWQQVFGEGVQYPQSGLIVREDVLEDDSYGNYVNILLSVLSTTSQIAAIDPLNAALLCTNKFGSTMLSSPEALQEAVDAKRVNIEFTSVNSSVERTASARQNVLDYLKTISEFSDTSAKLIGGAVPDDNLFLNMQAASGTNK